MKIRSPFLTKLIGYAVVSLLRVVGRTVRVDFRSSRPGITPFHRSPDPYLFSVWHDAIIIPIMVGDPLRHVNSVCALVSRHQDGSFLVEAMRHCGIRSVRGSRNHGGAQALRQLFQEIQHSHVFITPDGPRGPRRQLKDGILFLASHSGRPIIPVASACRKAWVIRGNWTDLLIPKPFSRAVYLFGEPFHVPPNLSRDELDRYRVRLQAEMERLDAVAGQIVAGHEPSGDLARAA
jgi:lysophospholipid acyltransferase (LPLAT)-like uncharacterized protein